LYSIQLPEAKKFVYIKPGMKQVVELNKAVENELHERQHAQISFGIKSSRLLGMAFPCVL
jgi:hypothetical protein